MKAAASDGFTADRTATVLSDRLRAAHAQLTEQWLVLAVDALAREAGRILPWRDLGAQIGPLILCIAEYIPKPEQETIAHDANAQTAAAQLAHLRFAHRATVPELLREFHLLADVLERFLQEQVASATPPLPGDEVARVMRRVTQSVRLLQQMTMETFVARYTDAIERQNFQLLSFGRMVGHEIRQPLSVLQVIGGVLPVREGDLELLHLTDMLERNVTRLADVAGRLEKLSHTVLESGVMPLQQPVNLADLAHSAMRSLVEAAAAQGVRVEIDPKLPTLKLDPGRIEMALASLLANAIKFADADKADRFAAVESVGSATRPAIAVRDNGVGIAANRAQHLFRELRRAHAHRDRQLRGYGLGLGLAIVRDVMDATGGEVTLSSVEGEGTTVTLSWPPSATDNEQRSTINDQP